MAIWTGAPHGGGGPGICVAWHDPVFIVGAHRVGWPAQLWSGAKLG
jgi:hypothetical protein